MEKKNRTSLSQKWENQLSQAGYRITQPRRAILDIIAETERPLTPVEIFDLAGAQSAGIGLVTVYRTIEKLEELHLVEHVHHLGDCQTVFRCSEQHQHLLICTKCGSSYYFDGLEVEEQFNQIGKKFGYRITEHWLQLAGLCEECQKNNPKDRK
ncbi:Fur family transcriptional regulator [Pelolinea submarina]|uniref:Fur family ferric uptake transcriptional regulator n=1 Tax=Pelolinea submarina TaxID=913107 RepID=A0A347ZWW6_9CHLR|nr:Fur family transcriptional regulator [Pelolinea submarina]REG05540.1 Fur family ferric uptake transcriptional regulator [Pelolinea submarina]BBB49797.1 Fur family transcriptional regulator, ferric uptake regulator [Pelolinea submarina]